MADSKITALTALTAADPANDMMPIVDVSDTSMAASGTTKRISINNILACSPTATLASATISGDLTVDTSTLKVDSTNNRVGINIAIPTAELHVIGGANFSDGTTTLRAVSSGNVAFLGTTTTDPLVLRVNNIEQYRMAQLGVFSWSDGAGGTRMTLNSTGLGVGQSPTAKLDIQGNPSSDANNTITGALTKFRDIYTRFRSNSAGISGDLYAAQLFSGGNAAFEIYSMTSYPLVFGTAATERLRIDSSGNVGIGVTPSAWDTANYKALQVSRTAVASLSNIGIFAANWFADTGGDKYIANGTAARIDVNNSGQIQFKIASSGTAGTAITFTQAMTLDASGNLILLSSNTPATLTANGQLTVNATSNTNLRFSYRGSDGTTRVANITLA